MTKEAKIEPQQRRVHRCCPIGSQLPSSHGKDRMWPPMNDPSNLRQFHMELSTDGSADILIEIQKLKSGQISLRNVNLEGIAHVQCKDHVSNK